MKDLNKALHPFFLEKTWGLTEAWYETLDKNDLKGVYSSTNPKVIKELKEQNYEFHVRFCEIFTENDSDFLKRFEGWVMEVSRSDNHLSTPIHYILREFFRTQEQYLDLFDLFIELSEGQFDPKELNKWRRKIIQAFEKIVSWFVEDYYKVSTQKLESQQETIKELSSPVIPVGGKLALLPLVGDIDTARAKVITENTLNKCIKSKIELLYIDLSGVAIIDTMVSQKIFQLIEGLKLIGVKTMLSGIRPELAQTAVQLGIDFNNVKFTSKLQLVKD